MGVFMYAPGVKVYISTQSHGVLDVSEDLTSGNLVRRSNGVSSFSFSLQNVRRKYDGIFIPNDRIIVMMKRITWLRVFTGYLNSVPLLTAWPQDIQFTASCSLKRLQYYYWDPALAASQSLVATAMNAAKNPDDGGVANAVLTVLNDVVGWPPSKVHIAGVPQNWVKWAYKIAKAVAAETAQADQLSQQFYSALSANGMVGGGLGGPTVATGALKAGTYGGQTVTASQCGFAVLIYNVAMQMGGSLRDAAVGIMTAMDESSLSNPPGGNADSIGLFQQRPSQGWGTPAQLANPSYAARAFFSALFKVTNRNSLSMWMEAQTVQRSGTPDGSNYQPFAAMATQMVSVMSNTAGGAQSVASLPGVQQTATQGKGGKASGSQLLSTGLTLVQQHPTIPYQEGGDSPPNTPASQVTFLDCSSFVQWCVFQTLGSLGPSGGCPRTSQDQSAWCQSAGRIITATQGMNIPGALMYVGQPGQAVHTEMSLGDGQHTVGAHHSGTYASVNQSAGAWTIAGLPPGFDYSGTPGTGPLVGAGGSTNIGFQLQPENQAPWYNPNDPFDKLFGTTPWIPTFDTNAAAIAAAFTGPRALLPDTPLLPYLANMINSTMRAYSSAPNGDLIAWFPDYYGIWGTAAAMRIEPVELQNFTVQWDDTYLVTHQFTAAPLAFGINLLAGTIANYGPVLAVTTNGIASIDIPGIMYALFGLEPTQAQAQKFINFILTRFGARPDYQQLPGVINAGAGEFFAALYLFMQNWAYQYNSDVSLTFMPELWPGMLIQIPEFAFQAYVTTVTHSFQFGPGGFFNTTINIAAPARLPGNPGDSSGRLIGLPVAGGLAGQPALPGKGGR